MPPSQKFADNAQMAVNAALRKVYLPKKFSQEKPPKNVIIVIGDAVVDQRSGKSLEMVVMMNVLSVSVNASAAVVSANARNM